MSLAHCTMEDLLALRDGDGTATARAHLADCPECQRELELLHQRVAALKALPAFRAPRDRWPVIRDAAQAARRRRARLRVSWIGLAAAASLTLFFGVRQLTGPAPAGAVTLDELMVRSQSLEEALRALDPTSRVLNGRTAGAIADLEDRIAVVDARLADRHSNNLSREDVLQLWQQRVELMDALINLHMTRAAYVGL